MKKILKKMLCGILAAVSVFGCAVSLTACETAKPEVEMTVEFNGESYTLEYVLYRNTAPQTVQHFLWLADNGYYDGLCVHDYSQSDYLRLYTGAYTAVATDDGLYDLVYKKYYDTVKGYANVGEFPYSVWTDKAALNPTYTLKGEFEDNNFRVESGDLSETFGSLTMYYNNIASYEEVAQQDVYMIRADGKDPSKCDYKYNYTTSMFYISLSNTTVNNKAYCTFAELQEDSKEKLENLQEALTDYIEEKHNDEVDSFTESQSILIGEDDPYLASQSVRVNYRVPKSAIVIKSVKVTKF